MRTRLYGFKRRVADEWSGVNNLPARQNEEREDRRKGQGEGI